MQHGNGNGNGNGLRNAHAGRNGHARADGLLGATVGALAGTLGLRDGCTSEHSGRVTALSGVVGRQLRLGARPLRDLAYAAELHDIGKVGVPDAVLLKKGPLGPAEWDVIRSHSAWGAELVQTVPGLERVARIVRHHHERYDGSGYPDGLEGDEIPVESRVLAVADAFVAMTEDRPYRRALGAEAALRELRDHRSAQFDPRAVDALAVEFERSPSAKVLA